MKRKYRLKTNLSWKGKHYKAGTEIELSAGDKSNHKIKSLFNKGLIEPVEDDTSQTGIDNDSGALHGDIPVDTLTDVYGVGESFAQRIAEKYRDPNTLMNTTPEELAGEIEGLSKTTAEKVIEHVLEVYL